MFSPPDPYPGEGILDLLTRGSIIRGLTGPEVYTTSKSEAIFERLAYRRKYK